MYMLSLPKFRLYGLRMIIIHQVCCTQSYGPFHVGVASRLATAIYVAMVTPILYDNSSSLNDSNLKFELSALWLIF